MSHNQIAALVIAVVVACWVFAAVELWLAYVGGFVDEWLTIRRAERTRRAGETYRPEGETINQYRDRQANGN